MIGQCYIQYTPLPLTLWSHPLNMLCNFSSGLQFSFWICYVAPITITFCHLHWLVEFCWIYVGFKCIPQQYGWLCKCGINHISSVYSSVSKAMFNRKRGHTYDTLCSMHFGSFQILHRSLALLSKRLLFVRSRYIRDWLTFRTGKKSSHFWAAVEQDPRLWKKWEQVYSEWSKECCR